MTIKIGGVYRFNGNFAGKEEDRYYKVLEDLGTQMMCLHLASNRKWPVFKSYWESGQMDLDESYTEDSVARRIRQLHKRQVPKHKFFSKEYSA